MVTGTSENQLHWVRGITFAADRSQVRTGSSPRVMIALCHLATAILQLAGVTNTPRRATPPRTSTRPAPARVHELLTAGIAETL